MRPVLLERAERQHEDRAAGGLDLRPGRSPEIRQ
jgi:hypothetical protein